MEGKSMPMTQQRAAVLKQRYKVLANLELDEIIELAGVYKEVTSYGETEFAPFVKGYLTCREREGICKKK
jgi:hypothetical protein